MSTQIYNRVTFPGELHLHSTTREKDANRNGLKLPLSIWFYSPLDLGHFSVS
jgi:hypothetical protein